MQVVTDERLALFAEMELKYEQKDVDYFVSLLEHPDYVVRTRVACIFVDFGGFGLMLVDFEIILVPFWECSMIFWSIWGDLGQHGRSYRDCDAFLDNFGEQFWVQIIVLWFQN